MRDDQLQGKSKSSSESQVSSAQTAEQAAFWETRREWDEAHPTLAECLERMGRETSPTRIAIQPILALDPIKVCYPDLNALKRKED